MSASRFAARMLMAWLAAAAAGDAFAQDELQPAEEVFRYTATADAERVYLDFDILEGHFLYAAVFGFGGGTAGVAIGAARYPRGGARGDEFFGEQETDRREFRIASPYRRSAAVETFDLKLDLQGCA